MSEPEPHTPKQVRAARDRHRDAAANPALGPTARRYHQHAACGYDWALRSVGAPTADHHLGYARAYAEQAANHAPATTRLALTLPGAFCNWLTATNRVPTDFTGDEAADRLLLALKAGVPHRISASAETLTVPAHDPVALLQITELAAEFDTHCRSGSGATPAEVRAATAIAQYLQDLAERHSAAK
ncbi:hypothetical protein [Kitasatospora griseola]